MAVLCGTLIPFYFYRKKRYERDHYVRVVNDFVDFLNIVHSNIGVGGNFDTAILNTPHEASRKLAEILRFGLSDDVFEQEIYHLFPIREVKSFTRQLLSTRKTGISQDRILSGTLDRLTEKHRLLHEAETMLFQKEMEGHLLSISPVALILLVNVINKTFMSTMYTTSTGMLVMTICFAMVVFMKWMIERVVKVEIDFDSELMQWMETISMSISAGHTLEFSLKELGIESIADMERMAALHHDKEMWKFIRLLKQYKKTGSPTVIEGIERHLKELSVQHFSSVKKSVEVAGLKLTFLLMIGLIGSILVIITPVIMMIKNI